MLLSMYLLYRLARSAKLRSYMPMVTVFILVVSVLPVIFPLTFLIGITFPVTFLSWPALFAVDPFHRIIEYIPETHEWNIEHATYHEAIFLTMKVETLDWHEFFVIAFSLSLFVNVLGASLGYWIGKKHRIQFFGSEWWRIFWGLVGGTLIVGIVVPVLSVPDIAYAISWRVGFTLIGFGIILLETIFLSWLIDKMRIPHPRKEVLDYVKIRYRRKRKKRGLFAFSE
jgi:hypothetical protein